MLPLSLGTMHATFEKMKAAASVTVTDPQKPGRELKVVCRQANDAKTILLLDPNNHHATAESLNLRAFVTRFKSVMLSQQVSQPEP